MRLLNTETHKLESFVDDRNRPPYAILSHVWGEEEVLFADLQQLDQDEVAKKKGYEKILGTCEQARRDGCDWAWIDSCCIDKSSSAELSEAINAMYAWYSEAAIRYVYLADVEMLPRETEIKGTARHPKMSWTSPHQRSRSYALSPSSMSHLDQTPSRRGIKPSSPASGSREAGPHRNSSPQPKSLFIHDNGQASDP